MEHKKAIWVGSLPQSRSPPQRSPRRRRSRAAPSPSSSPSPFTPQSTAHFFYSCPSLRYLLITSGLTRTILLLLRSHSGPSAVRGPTEDDGGEELAARATVAPPLTSPVRVRPAVCPSAAGPARTTCPSAVWRGVERERRCRRRRPEQRSMMARKGERSQYEMPSSLFLLATTACSHSSFCLNSTCRLRRR